MIIQDAKPPIPPNDDVTLDSPPSYDTLVPLERKLLRDAKPNYSYSPISSSSSWPSSAQCPTSPSSSSLRSPTTPGSSKGKGKAPSSWFNFAATRTSREVHTTVLGLVRDLIREHYADSAAPAGILQSCADACAAHDLDLHTILQEKSIEGHTPLYWAIVKRKPDEEIDDNSQVPDLLTALLSHSSPLQPATIADIRLACLVTSDQKLFHRLRMSPEFSKVSGADQILLGATQPQDEIEVHEVAADDGSFAVDFVIPHFQKRLMVTKLIELEFIARSRMWRLAFVVAKSYQYTGIQGGSWCVELSLQPNSPPTWLDGQLVISDPTLAYSSTRSSPRSSPLLSRFTLNGDTNPKPPIAIRMKTGFSQLSAPGGATPGGNTIVVALEKNPSASTLQYSGTSYIAPDEKLRARFEARLQKSEDNQECIIC
ncbi:hypothetical protein CC1G_11136 [Coprinopsis cinerea okayama7|uniref:Uncharacterized protein n=1 Tax=Coprinopsis cinerea (strain Okayama-7 / 130 / ATCC MYA-4618 / FGSC 9003) TaxID=240176 RepID=A8N4S1_COPC7|nr:hypothetical protein CC1G_11136 [Coprinopsis cinerea okayama7\|eukprot:XP_001829866.1 hypothetical protein CC1G_11136 [Coprinopsis cinerea okayama7\